VAELFSQEGDFIACRLELGLGGLQRAGRVAWVKLKSRPSSAPMALPVVASKMLMISRR